MQSKVVQKKLVSNNLETVLDDWDLGRSLPSFVYTSEEIFSLELERIFYSKWLAVCHSSQLKNKGDIRVQQIGSKSIVLVRGQDDVIRAFYNVCRHRGARLLGESKNAKVIQCRYHGWTYRLDGTLAGCPDMQDYQDFDLEKYCLYKVQIDFWGGFVWINLDPHPESLFSYLGDFCDKFQKYKMEELQWVTSVGRYNVKANWKTIMENANECYHCPTVHPETLGPYYRQVVPYDEESVKGPYVFIVWKEYTKSTGNAVDIATQQLGGRSLDLDESQSTAMPFPTVFPTAQFVITPDWVASFIAWPKKIRETEVLIDLFFRRVPETEEEKEVAKYLDLVNSQDFAITEVQQEGLNSGVFGGCEFNSLEKSVRHFQKMYMQSLKTL